MPMILAMNGFDDFGELAEFGASASQAIGDLQSSLVALGNGIRDSTLMKIVIDGIMGPKTAAATNRALTVHLGPGQAPANLRTGALSQQLITSQAGSITQLIDAEIQRRGFPAPKPKTIAKVKPKAKASTSTSIMPAFVPTAAAPAAAVTATSPVYRVPSQVTAAGGGMDLGAVMKWAAIGVGAVVVAGVAYYFLTKPKGRPAMAGYFAGEGERGHPFG